MEVEVVNAKIFRCTRRCCLRVSVPGSKGAAVCGAGTRVGTIGATATTAAAAAAAAAAATATATATTTTTATVTATAKDTEAEAEAEAERPAPEVLYGRAVAGAHRGC